MSSLTRELFRDFIQLENLKYDLANRGTGIKY
jgi:hypothetical protein